MFIIYGFTVNLTANTLIIDCFSFDYSFLLGSPVVLPIPHADRILQSLNLGSYCKIGKVLDNYLLKELGELIQHEI